MLFWKGVEVTGLSERLYSRFNLEAVLAYMGVENVSLAFGREYAYNLNISIIRLYNYFKEVFECFRNRKIITWIDIFQDRPGLTSIRVWYTELNFTVPVTYLSKVSNIKIYDLVNNTKFQERENTVRGERTIFNADRLLDLYDERISDCMRERFSVNSITLVVTRDINTARKIYKGYGIAVGLNYDDLYFENSNEYRITYFVEDNDINDIYRKVKNF